MDDNTQVWPGDARLGEVELVEQRLVWENDVVRLYNDRVRVPSPDGGDPVEKVQFRLGHAPNAADGVVIVPITNADEILLVRQFRHPVRMWVLELPRGGTNAGEPPASAARREVHEELGCETRETWPLGRVVNDSGQVAGIPHLFAARVVEGGTPERETGEAIERVCRYRYSELRAACERGDIVDSFTLAAVLRVAPHFEGDRFRWNAEAAPIDPIAHAP